MKELISKFDSMEDKFICLGPIGITDSEKISEYILSDIPFGISQDDSYIFHRTPDTLNCYSRQCDHNNGRLSLTGTKAICPLHGWTFDPATGNYDDVQVSKYQKKLLLIAIIIV